MKKTVQFRHFSNRHFSQVVTNSDSSALHIRHFTQMASPFHTPLLLEDKLPTISISMPELNKVRTASVGVQTIGSLCRLNDVFITTGTPVRSPNLRIQAPIEQYVHYASADFAGRWMFLPAFNTLLNGLCAIALCVGLHFIKHHNIDAHRTSMLLAFTFSSVFLISYIVNHALHGDTIFPGHGPVRTLHLTTSCGQIQTSPRR